MTVVLVLITLLLSGPMQSRPEPPPRMPDHLRPVPTVDLRWREDSVAPNTWQGLEAEDLLARMMLSEQSYKILDNDLFADAIGAAFVARNRVHGWSNGPRQLREDDAYWYVLAQGQFYGLTGGNAHWAADPDSYPTAFAVGDPLAGRKAYWRARMWAGLVIDGVIPDPTDGATMFADAYIDGTRRERTAFWGQGSRATTLDDREATTQ